MLYFTIETLIGRKTLLILKSSRIKQRFKSHVAAQLPENVIFIMLISRVIVFNGIRPLPVLY